MVTVIQRLHAAGDPDGAADSLGPSVAMRRPSVQSSSRPS